MSRPLDPEVTSAKRGIGTSGRLRYAVIAAILVVGACAGGCGSSSSTTSSSTISTGTAKVSAPTFPASAGEPVAAALLVAQSRDLPGFSGAEGTPQVTTSAARWAEIDPRGVPGSEPADQHEVPNLTHEGFQEGVRESFQSGSGEAISIGIVFRSPRGAREYFSPEVNPERLRNEGLALEHATAPGVPGAVITGGGQNGNVFFTTGRCFVLVGNHVPEAGVSESAHTPAEEKPVNAAPIAGATAVYQRVQHNCA
jgi:hypothetical protein